MDKKDYMKILGDNIKTLRDEAGLTQDQLSEKASLASTYLSRIETGAAMPSVFIVEHIALALNVSPSLILPLAKLSDGYSKIDMLLESATPETQRLAEKIVRVLINESTSNI